MPDEALVAPPKEDKIIPLEALYAEYNAMREDLFRLADMLPDGEQMKTTILDADKKIQELQAGREAKVLECHPDGKHWPPHSDCPLCQKVFEKWDRKARERMKELGLADTEENWEIALKDYMAQRH